MGQQADFAQILLKIEVMVSGNSTTPQHRGNNKHGEKAVAQAGQSVQA